MKRPTINAPLVWSSLALAATAIMILIMLPPVLGAALSGTDATDRIEDEFARLMTDHEQTLDESRARFNGRSAFFKPRQPRVAPPPRPPRDDPPKVAEEPKGPPPPAPPPRKPPYGGPGIRAMIGDQVWFEGDLRVAVGEEKDGMKVLSVDAPWSATVEFQSWEYELDLFEGGMDQFLRADVSAAPEAAPAGDETVQVLTGDGSGNWRLSAGAEMSSVTRPRSSRGARNASSSRGSRRGSREKDREIPAE